MPSFASQPFPFRRLALAGSIFCQLWLTMYGSKVKSFARRCGDTSRILVLHMSANISIPIHGHVTSLSYDILYFVKYYFVPCRGHLCKKIYAYNREMEKETHTQCYCDFFAIETLILSPFPAAIKSIGEKGKLLVIQQRKKCVKAIFSASYTRLQLVEQMYGRQQLYVL